MLTIRALFSPGTAHARRVIVLIAAALHCAVPGAAIAQQIADPVADPDPQRFADLLSDFAHWDEGNIVPRNATLFVGSSSIQRWRTAAAFPETTVLNRGMGGAHISDINRLFDRLVEPYQPARIVFYAGDNDIGSGKAPERVLQDWQAFVARVRIDWPDLPILFLSIKPSVRRWERWPVMERANQLIAEDCASRANVTYVDVASVLLNSDGTPKAVFVEDELHLNDAGYMLWNTVLAQYLD